MQFRHADMSPLVTALFRHADMSPIVTVIFRHADMSPLVTVIFRHPNMSPLVTVIFCILCYDVAACKLLNVKILWYFCICIKWYWHIIVSDMWLCMPESLSMTSIAHKFCSPAMNKEKVSCILMVTHCLCS